MLRFNKGIYGLKQSGLQWNKTITQVFETLGFEQSRYDPCFFFVRDRSSNALKTFIVLFVDDILCASVDQELLNQVKRNLSERFQMALLGVPSRYLGLELHRNAAGIFVNQTQFIDELLAKYNMTKAAPQYTPMSQRPTATGPDDEPFDVRSMREIVGSLLFLSGFTRPDIACAVSHLARHQAKPSKQHFTLAKRILRYLIGTRTLSLCFPAKPSPALLCFCDADYAGDEDSRKSINGFVFTLGGTPLMWMSMRQTSVALSTTEAEYALSLLQLSKPCIFKVF